MSVVSKERSSDRILVLQTMEGEKPLSSMGIIDPRLFNGENKLHAVRDARNSLWSLKYEMGSVPEILKQRFVSFPSLMQHTTKYFNRRNIQIVDIID